ncbi:MAG: hypothetical protein KatS3mg078_0113 [Deltaproteobacteria bacterium]|nr:MAG: hypothetical protein KatS3mg078_0113 [Deltaproteobacteria bacterium]
MKIENIKQYLVIFQKNRFVNRATAAQQDKGKVNETRAKEQKEEKNLKSPANNLFDFRAVFALNEDNEVVIKILDEKGELIRQIPPEEFLKMVKKLKEVTENLFSKKV